MPAMYMYLKKQYSALFIRRACAVEILYMQSKIIVAGIRII